MQQRAGDGKSLFLVRVNQTLTGIKLLAVAASRKAQRPSRCFGNSNAVFDNIYDGTVLVDIVPAKSVLLARAQVLPQHVVAVRRGQIARLSVSAYDPSRYGVLMGVVQRVATNTTQPENQMPYYETIIEIPEVRLTKSGIQPEITPGMPLTVDILGDKRTVMNYIITPIEKSWKSAFREQ